MVRRAFALLWGTLALAAPLAACVQAPSPRFGAPNLWRPDSTAAPTPRIVALLAPLTGPYAERGAALVNAARLALSPPGSPTLDVRDTAGSAQGAANAARLAIGAGATLIIGPLTAAETAGVAAVARQSGVPVLAFTNDTAQAQPGVWTLGITPGQQVRRMVGAVASQGKTRFAAVLPRSDFGNAMGSALTQATSILRLPRPDIRTYGGGESMDSAVKAVASNGGGGGLAPLLDELRNARDQHDPAAAAALPDQNAPPPPAPPPPIDALLLAETGSRLATLAGLLRTDGIDPAAVRTMGPALWSAPGARGGAALNSAWFAAPDPHTRDGFDAAYNAQYGSPAPGISDFAYDAASVARVLGERDGYSVQSLCRSDGYSGVDGVFALEPDGYVRRGLALFEMRDGAPQVIEAAPTSLQASGI